LTFIHLWISGALIEFNVNKYGISKSMNGDSVKDLMARQGLWMVRLISTWDILME